MSRFIDRVREALGGRSAVHDNDHVGAQERGDTHEHGSVPAHGGEEERVGDDNRVGEHEHGAHEGHKHC